MTCIVGLLDGGRAYLGGDSAGASNWFSIERKDEKVFRNGPFLMGFTDSFRMGQLLRYAFNPPERQPEEPVYRYMVTTFINAVRDCLKAGGYAKRENEQESSGVFLVAYQGRLFMIDNDYQVAEAACGYNVVGCGRDLAFGALYATRGQSPKERVLVALQAAAEFSNGVRPPFVILESELQ